MSELPPPPPVYTGTVKDEANGFFSALFDFSFRSFITPKLVKVVYILSVVGVGLFLIVGLIAAFTNSATSGALFLIFGPIGAIMWLALIRVTLEFYLATVRMSEDIHKRLPVA